MTFLFLVVAAVVVVAAVFVVVDALSFFIWLSFSFL